MTEATAIATTEQPPDAGALVRPSGDIVLAIQAYRELQGKLDESLPDCLMKIRGSTFRKKNYWRAVATAFNLDVKITEERFIDGKNWRYEITCTATAPNGRHADGDGACSREEKIVYFWRNREQVIDEAKTRANATNHNVRAHAHTRAYNRAVSNLVGFGEVSADEVRPDDPEPHVGQPTVRQSQRTRGATLPAQQPTRDTADDWTPEQRAKVDDLRKCLGLGWRELCKAALAYEINEQPPTRSQALVLIAWLEGEHEARQHSAHAGEPEATTTEPLSWEAPSNG